MDKCIAKRKESHDDQDIHKGSSHGIAGCFEPIRPRTHSFDLHQLMHHNKLTKISRLFRSRSEGNVKSPKTSPSPSPKSSPRMSPRGSPALGEGTPKRRFMRVVRDDQSSGEEYDNPHVIRKYSKQYAQSLCLRKSQSMGDEPRNLPYTVSGNTILKKFSSFESPSTSQVATPDHSPPSSKHASFLEEIEVIEYDKKEKLLKHKFMTHRERISFDEMDSDVGSCSITEEVSFQSCSLDEVSEEEEYDPDPEDQGVSHDDVFLFDEDQKEKSSTEQAQAIDTPTEDSITNSPDLSRQLSSDSDVNSTDSDQPSKKKKTKLADEAIRTNLNSKHTKAAQMDSVEQKFEVES